MNNVLFLSVLTYNLTGLGVRLGRLFALDAEQFDRLLNVLEDRGKEARLHGTDVELTGERGEDTGHLLLTRHTAFI